MSRESRLNERAAAAAAASLWHVDDGWSVFAGPLHHNDPHAHSAAVFLAGLAGALRLRIGGGDWLSCRAAVVPAGIAYEFDVGGDPLGVLYLEPDMGRADALAGLARDTREVGGALVAARADTTWLRSMFEDRASIEAHTPEVGERLGFAERRARKPIDPRIARIVRELSGAAPEPLSAGAAGARVGLSASRFQHLFTAEVGVPYRRYRSWQRLRAAIREIRRGSSYTAAAHAAGFADQAHFARQFRRTFGAPASRGL